MGEATTDGVWSSTDCCRDPRHVFLVAREVIGRYGWGKTRGYQYLKDRELVPPPLMTHPARWRLDQLLAWEDRRIAAAEALAVETTAGTSTVELLRALLPAPKPARRLSA